METLFEGPYQKLAKTPLALKHKICGQEPRTMTIILGIVSLFIDPLPNFWMAYEIYNMQTVTTKSIWEDDERFNDPFFKKHHRGMDHDKDMFNIPRTICAGLGCVFGFIQIIGIIVLLVGAYRNNTRYFYCWCCTMICQTFMGRFGFMFFMLVLKVKWALVIVVLCICDILLVIAMFYSMGQMATVERNKRYMSMGAVRYEIQPKDPQAAQTLIPPSAYPHQA